MSDDKKTPVTTPAPTRPPERASTKHVADPAPFVEGGTWTDGKQVHRTEDPESPPPRAPRRSKQSGGRRK